MTPPEHLLIGLSLANTIHALQLLAQKRYFSYLFLFLVLGMAAMAPDADSFFGHYSSRDPLVGHRGMTHSIAFAIALSLLIPAVLFLLAAPLRSLRTGNSSSPAETGRDNGDKSMLALFIFLAVLSHLLADLPQPPGIWKGIPLFFPLKSGGEYLRNGGWSMLGWYDYRILWGLIAIFAASLFFMVCSTIFRRKSLIARSMLLIILLINISWCVWLVSYISASQYLDAGQWNNLQKQYLDSAAPFIRETTLKAKSAFMRYFMKIH